MASLRELFRKPLSRRTLFAGAAALLGAGVAGRWLMRGFSGPEEGALLGMKSHADGTPGAGPFIDVSEFKKGMTVESLNQTAENYFASIKNWDALLAKPLAQVEDTPVLLTNFAQVLNGLQLAPGMSVLDFGAGSCWASRWLTQLGMEAIALDVSATALKIGRELYARQPVIGERPAPRFVLFDGHRIDLPDASVDRIMVLDAFHHLLNPAEVLGEMGRVLKPGGIAGFSEPGPAHSRSSQSQYEMRNFKVLEDDIDMQKIWAWASKAGFARLRLAVYAPHTFLLTLPEFEDYLDAGAPNKTFADVTRERMRGVRLFFLHKAGFAPLDSRSRAALAARLEVKLASSSVKAGEPLTAQVSVTNSSRAVWLPRGAGRGAVLLGSRLIEPSAQPPEPVRHGLTPGSGRPVQPGETVQLEVTIAAPPKGGSYVLEFDLVSEEIAWFSQVGLQPVRISVRFGG